MLKNIPTHLLAGPLGAGKTSLIRHLLAQRPASERWAVLINEFGAIGLDAALLSTDDDGIALGEVAGGCLCCVNGLPFQVGLSRLLRKAKPDRLLIEPSGLGHPLELLRQLREPPWTGVLAVQPLVLVLDGAALAAGARLPDSQQDALASAGLLLLNKAEQLDAATKARLQTHLPARPLRWTSQAAMDLADLPGFSATAIAAIVPVAPVAPGESEGAAADAAGEADDAGESAGAAGNASTVDDTADGTNAVVAGDASAANTTIAAAGNTGLGGLPRAGVAMPQIWRTAEEPICQVQAQPEGWSIGWRWHPSQTFELLRVQQWLEGLDWRRAKLVLQTNAGWLSGNALDCQPIHWQGSEWRNDSRLELIFREAQDVPRMQAGLQACRL